MPTAKVRGTRMRKAAVPGWITPMVRDGGMAFIDTDFVDGIVAKIEGSPKGSPAFPTRHAKSNRSSAVPLVDGIAGCKGVEGEVKLWMAVFVTAWQDATIGPSTFSTARILGSVGQREAYDWLMSPDQGIGSFEWIAQNIGIDAEAFRRRLREWVANQSGRPTIQRKNGR